MLTSMPHKKIWRRIGEEPNIWKTTKFGGNLVIEKILTKMFSEIVDGITN